LGKWGNLLLTVETPGRTFAGSFRFLALFWSAQIAQLAEHVLGKDEVTSSSLVLGSIVKKQASSGFCDTKSQFFIIIQPSVSHG